MKKIEAIIRRTKFEEVKEALLAADIEWFSYYEVRGVGKTREGRIYRGVVYDTSSIERILISIVVVVVIGYLFMQSIGFIQVFVKSGRSTSMLKIPYSWVYGIAIVSYFDMIISYFYALFRGVKSEAKEAASSNE